MSKGQPWSATRQHSSLKMWSTNKKVTLISKLVVFLSSIFEDSLIWNNGPISHILPSLLHPLKPKKPKILQILKQKSPIWLPKNRMLMLGWMQVTSISKQGVVSRQWRAEMPGWELIRGLLPDLRQTTANFTFLSAIYPPKTFHFWCTKERFSTSQLWRITSSSVETRPATTCKTSSRMQWEIKKLQWFMQWVRPAKNDSTLILPSKQAHSQHAIVCRQQSKTSPAFSGKKFSPRLTFQGATNEKWDTQSQCG